MATFRCCLMTPDPGPWTAGVDDSADPRMIAAMHGITGRLSGQMPLGDFIWALRASVQIDSRTGLGGDIQRCMLSMAAQRLELLGQRTDSDACWKGWRYRLRDAWAVWKGRAAPIYLRD